MRWFHFLSLSIFAVLTGCGTTPFLGYCSDSDTVCLHKLQYAHQTTTVAYWQESINKPLQERVSAADDVMLEYLHISNRIYNDPVRAQLVNPQQHQKLFDAVRAAIDELPAQIKSYADDNLAGVVLVRNLGATAEQASIYNSEGKSVMGRIALDVDALNRTANQWATWKENTPFDGEGAWSVEVIIEEEENDNVKNAVQYILLHELAHIIALNNNLHPRPGTENNNTDWAAYPWLAFSWQWHDQRRYISSFDNVFLGREKIHYYFGKQLSGKQLLTYYQGLSETNFVTMYGATNPYDDWAEAFVTWVHVELMKRPFSVKILKQGEEQYQYQLCWAQPRCAAKRQFMIDYLEENVF